MFVVLMWVLKMLINFICFVNYLEVCFFVDIYYYYDMKNIFYWYNWFNILSVVNDFIVYINYWKYIYWMCIKYI